MITYQFAVSSSITGCFCTANITGSIQHQKSCTWKLQKARSYFKNKFDKYVDFD